MCARHRCLIRFALLLLLLIPPEVGRAQQSSSPPYRGFQFDSLFRVGADDFSMTNMAWLKDSLRLDFIRMYGGPSRVTDTLLFTTDPDAADTAWILALNHQRTAWFNRLLLARWHELWQIGLKVVYAFDPIAELQSRSRAVEGLYDYDPAYVHAASFARKNDTAHFAVLNDTLFGGFAHAIRIDSSSSAGLTFAAGQMKFANRGLTLAALDTTTYRTYVDSVERRHELAVAIRVLDQFLGPELHDTTQLAEIHLFARDTIWQSEKDSCRCAFFTPFDTVRITRGTYDSIAIHSPWAMGSAFRDIIHTFTFPDDTLYGAGDTNIRYRFQILPDEHQTSIVSSHHGDAFDRKRRFAEKSFELHGHRGCAIGNTATCRRNDIDQSLPERVVVGVCDGIDPWSSTIDGRMGHRFG